VLHFKCIFCQEIVLAGIVTIFTNTKGRMSHVAFFDKSDRDAWLPVLAIRLRFKNFTMQIKISRKCILTIAMRRAFGTSVKSTNKSQWF
jgi:hypothetical protein